MRVPLTVPAYAFEAYRCSEETILLPGELDRTLRSENETWDNEKGIPADLKTLALRVIAANWRDDPVDLDELPTTEDRDNLLEMLPLNLPFELAVARIPYDHYWERAAEARWRFNDPACHGGSWLRLYCERHLAEYLEQLEPAYFGSECAECERLLELVREHVRTLELRQLVPHRPDPIPKGPVETFEDDDEDEVSVIPQPTPLEEPDVHHIPLDLIFDKLPHLREISINIGMIFRDDKVDTRDFEFSVEDGVRIGRGVKNLEHLKKFCLTRSNLDRPRAAAILQGLVVNNSLVELDFSHCKLGDKGAYAIGAFLSRKRERRAGNLRSIRLANNGIGPKGIAGIVRGLLKDHKSYDEEEVDKEDCSIVASLDLRLNPLGDEGANHLAALLLRYASLEYLNISGCCMGGDGGMAMAEVLASGRTNFTALRIDCSNNEFGDIVGEAFEIVAKACIAIIELDVRMCGFRKESEYSISESVSRNRAKSKKERAAAERRRSSARSFEAQLKRASSLIPPEEFEIFQRRHSSPYQPTPIPSESTVIAVSEPQDSYDAEEEQLPSEESLTMFAP